MLDLAFSYCFLVKSKINSAKSLLSMGIELATLGLWYLLCFDNLINLTLLVSAWLLWVVNGGVYIVIGWSLRGSYICFTTTSLDTFDTSLLPRLCTTCQVPIYCYASPNSKHWTANLDLDHLYCTVQGLKYESSGNHHCLSNPGANWLLIHDLQWGSWLQCRWQLGQCLFGTIHKTETLKILFSSCSVDFN